METTDKNLFEIEMNAFKEKIVVLFKILVYIQNFKIKLNNIKKNYKFNEILNNYFLF